MKSFSLNSGKRIMEYTVSESFKITSNELMLNKVSFCKSIVKHSKNPECLGISALVTIEDYFTLLTYYYNDSKKVEVTQKKVVLNSKLADLSKKIVFTKLICDLKSKVYFIIVGTNSKVYLQELEDPKNFKLVFDSGENNDINITNIFEGLSNNKQSFNNFNIILNDSIIVELDFNKSEMLSENFLQNYLSKNKLESKMKIVNFEYTSISNEPFIYSVLLNNDENKYVRSIIKFNEVIEKMKYRPKFNFKNTKAANYEVYEKNNHLAISFSNGKLGVFHYESKALIFDYKSKFGNVIYMDYSPDGRLLGIGTQSDTAFIIDAEFGGVLYCLDGHKNYVSSIFFEEILNEDQGSISNTTSTDEALNNFSSQQTHRGSRNMSTKELNLKDFLNLIIDSDENNNKPVDIRGLKRIKTIVSNSNVINDDNKNNKVYEVYTAGLDGNIAIWKIDHFYDEDQINNKNYFILPSSKETILKVKTEITNTHEIAFKEETQLFYTDFCKATKTPINFLYKIDDVFLIVGKRNAIGTTISMLFVQGKLKVEEEKKGSQVGEITEKISNEDNSFNTPIKQKNKTMIATSYGSSTVKDYDTTNAMTSSYKTPDKRNKISNKLN